jgi:hypothetical protein
MKKIILEIILGLTLPTAIFHTQLFGLFSADKAVNKEINLSIARDGSYNQKVYDSSVASIHVIIFKVANNKQTILWDKTYADLQLKQYPTVANALQQTITVHNIKDKKEKLFVTYSVTYKTNGNKMLIENGTSLEKGESKGHLFINL